VLDAMSGKVKGQLSLQHETTADNVTSDERMTSHGMG